MANFFLISCSPTGEQSSEAVIELLKPLLLPLTAAGLLEYWIKEHSLYEFILLQNVPTVLDIASNSETWCLVCTALCLLVWFQVCRISI